MVGNDGLRIALVNEKDEITGFADKFEVHREALLHRAFSIFIFNENKELLLQRRSLSKYHSPGLWTNTCCSHFIEGYKFEDYIYERLFQEMGFDCELEFGFVFHYKTAFDNCLTENEIDHVYFGKWNGVPDPDPEEVDDFRWMSIIEINRDIENNPGNYTYWFKKVFEKLRTYKPELFETGQRN